MHRFYLPPEQCRQGTVELTGAEARHAVQVLRLRPGEGVVVLDGAGLELRCEALAAQRGKVTLAVLDQRAMAPLPCRVTLLPALPKGQLIEAIIQKATELGVSRIVPLLTERVVAHLGRGEAVRKAEKWQRVAIEAIKQCGLAWLPEVQAPLTPAEWLARREQIELPLLASLQPGSSHPRRGFDAFRSKHGREPRSACVWVGPEGDFTPAETDAIKAAGTLPISLGPWVLRAETAAIYCLSVLNYELSARGERAAPGPGTAGPGTADA